MKYSPTSGQAMEISKIVLPMKPNILREFDKLKEGESMVIANEQNPYILYYQLLEDRGNIFKWEYLEEGPEKWRVKITKQQQDFPAPTIGEIAAIDYAKAEAFRHYGIAFCCAGEKTVEEACEEAGISEEILEQYIDENALPRTKEVYTFEKWGAGFLADYIVNTHHSYLKDNLGMIYGMALNVMEQQGRENPEIRTLASHLNYFFSELADHMHREEQTIFPLIRKMAAAKMKYKRAFGPVNNGLRDTISKMFQEHRELGESLRFIRKITGNYQLPADACSSYTILYAKLMEFENDLVQHIHLENNILFPKVLALEQELSDGAARG